MPIIEDTSIINGEKITLKIEVDKIPIEKSDENSSYWSNTRGDGAAKNILTKVENAFHDGLELTKNCAKQIVHSFNQMSDEIKPEEVQVQIGINLGTEAGIVLAKTSANAQMQVTMTWKPNRNE